MARAFLAWGLMSRVGGLAWLALVYLAPGRLAADELRVAVASNFIDTARVVAGDFEAASGHRVVLVSGSTGKHYAQIHQGAALDAFLAADSRSPELLEAEGLAIAGSRFTYARGRLVLWSARAGYVDGMSVVSDGDYRHLAIAQPRLAPYGRAAQETLERQGLWDRVQPRLVRGENIGQAFQFVVSGNAELGFVAYAQVLGATMRSGARRIPTGSHWLVPERLHSPIEQQAVLLRDLAAPREFLAFLRGDRARRVLEQRGYVVPVRGAP